jgi:uncharacterized repeat protein (TIGR02543 family)
MNTKGRKTDMYKKILRILSLTLALLLVISVAVPAPATAAATTADEIKQQIKTTYKRAKSYYGRNSFDGYCGAFVTAELYLMGITATPVGFDGKDAYNAFHRQSVTSGGYGVKAYPAKAYSLRSALNEITKNGTQNAHNILVGFEKTPSAAGRRYGHAVVIHAILDGTVYFAESYGVTLNGKRYAEGAPISCSIPDFCNYYASTTIQLDGVIYFGLKTYADKCVDYATSAWGFAASEGQLWSQPCESDVDASSEPVRVLTAGEQLNITGLYMNTAGEYWYELDQADSGYVRAEHVTISQLRFDDVTILGATAPTVLSKGKPFNVKGTILSEMNSIYSVRARVYGLDGTEMTQLIHATEMVACKSYELAGSDISKKLSFRDLEVGRYRYELAAIVGNYYVENGQLLTGWDTVNLWSADFLVAEENTGVNVVTFDACGGNTGLNRSIVATGQKMGQLPIAQRQGYVFLGWYTEAEGGDHITADDVLKEDMICYARWISLEELQAGWLSHGTCWYLYSDGVSTMGCIEVEGTLYYFSLVDPLGQSWMMWTAAAAE